MHNIELQQYTYDDAYEQYVRDMKELGFNDEKIDQLQNWSIRLMGATSSMEIDDDRMYVYA